MGSPALPTDELPAGAILENKYRIIRLIGAGGMGVVYEALHIHLQKPVAVKVLRGRFGTNADAAQRLIREARAASSTGHPNVVAVTDMGFSDRAPFFVMELLEGECLADALAYGAYSLAEATQIIIQVLDGLDAIHEAGVVHRDLKPQNVMLVGLSSGAMQVKLLDFGISQSHDEVDNARGNTGVIVGTPQWMSPEQALGEPVDRRTDIHAAGGLFYALLVGESPFGGPTATSTLARVIEGHYEPASIRVPGLPARVDRIIAKAMAVDREDRFPSAVSMRNAVESMMRPAARPRAPTLEGLTEPQPLAMGGTASPSVSSPSTTAWPQVGQASGEATALQIDMPVGWNPAGEGTGTPPAPSRGGGPWERRMWIVAATITGVLAVFAGVHQLEGLFSAWATPEGESPSVSESQDILLLVQTHPTDATVWVDNVQRRDQPIVLPRSMTPVRVRVEASRYVAEERSVTPDRSQRLRINLRRQR